MQRIFKYDEKNPGGLILNTMVIFALSLILFGLICDTPFEIAAGLQRILSTPAALISDSIVIGGMGAAFVNAGLVTLISIALICLCKIPFSGATIAAIFLMGGFALFGKDIANIFPIIAGGWLYAKYRKEKFGRYLYISLFGTALAPVVTELAVIGGDNRFLSTAIPLLVGVGVGFVLPGIAVFTVRVHQGYNLYNVGFAAGLVGMVLASLLKSVGYVFETRLEWSTGNNLHLAAFLFILFGAMIFTGFYYNGKSFHGFRDLTRHSGRAVADFIMFDSYPVVLINMGVIGAVATVYVLMVGGELNGPTIGGILSICGFGGFGKHLKNMWPPICGVVLSSFIMVWKLNDPAVLLAALFSTGLSPIAGQFGWKWGIVAGILHSSVVLNTSLLHGGLNLYNNGFAAGLVCIVLVPLIEGLHPHSDEDI